MNFRKTTLDLGQPGPVLAARAASSPGSHAAAAVHTPVARPVMLQKQGQSVQLVVLQLQLQYWTLQMVGLCCSTAFT